MSLYTDIHCHLLPGIDDGPKAVEDALAMAQLAVDDGMECIVATPHQLGAFARNRGDAIRELATEMQETLRRHEVPLRVLPGGEARIVPGLVLKLLSGEVLSLGDRGKHVLLEMPHQTYVPIGPLLAELKRHGYTAILAHPERNGGILSQPHHLQTLISEGCLLQVTASSLLGSFGSACQGLAEQMVRRAQVHFVASDGHNAHSRRPVLRAAFERVCELASEAAAETWCCRNPALVAAGEPVPTKAVAVKPRRRRWWPLTSKAV